MIENINIALPSKPEVVEETDTQGTYVISGLFPGYGNTLGNALRRMLLSSIPGVAITNIRIKGVPHEFSVLDGVKDDILTIILKMKKIRVSANTDIFPQTIHLKKKGKGVVTAGDFELPAQVEIVNKDLVITELTDDKVELDIEADLYQGIGFQPHEELEENPEIGSVAVDAAFSPVRRSSYEVRNMRVGDRTDYNRLSIFLETDGSITPREALNTAIDTMIVQLQSMVGFQSDGQVAAEKVEKETVAEMKSIKLDELNLSAAITSKLEQEGVVTLDDILKKGVLGLQSIPGIGPKAIKEIAQVLEARGVVLKDSI